MSQSASVLRSLAGSALCATALAGGASAESLTQVDTASAAVKRLASGAGSARWSAPPRCRTARSRAASRKGRGSRRRVSSVCRPRLVRERFAGFDPGAPGSAPLTGGTAPGGGPAPAPVEPLGRYLGVSAHEFTLTLSRPVLGAGSQTVELRNRGEDPHNLVISPNDASHTPLYTFPDTLSLALARLDVELAAGDYLLWCSLSGHEAQGMKATLQVR